VDIEHHVRVAVDLDAAAAAQLTGIRHADSFGAQRSPSQL
jgi:hypothetical protein